MLDILTANKAIILKLLTAGLTGLCMWLNKKYQVGLDATAIAGVGASVILGIAFHAAAKDHGVGAQGIVQGVKDAEYQALLESQPPKDGPSGAGKAAGIILLFVLLPFMGGGCQGVRLDKKVMGDYKAAHDIIIPEYQAFLDGKPPVLTDAQKADRAAIIRKIQEIDQKGVQ